MTKKLKVELGVLGGCALLIAGTNIAIQNQKSDEPLTESSVVEVVSSTVDPESEVIVYTTTAATTPETTSATTAATTAETTIAAPAETTADTTLATVPNEQIVYVAKSGEGSKYHRIQDCGNMESVRELTISEAEALGYTPCKRCY